MGPTSAALDPDAVHRDLSLVRDRLDTPPLRPRSAFDLVTAIRLQMLRSQESLVADAAARAADLEKRVMRIDPVKAEAVLTACSRMGHERDRLDGHRGRLRYELPEHARSRLALWVRVRVRPDGIGRGRARRHVPTTRLALTPGTGQSADERAAEMIS
jgi:hypothetical protein